MECWWWWINDESGVVKGYRKFGHQMSANKISGNTHLVLNRESSRIITTPPVAEEKRSCSCLKEFED